MPCLCFREHDPILETFRSAKPQGTDTINIRLQSGLEASHRYLLVRRSDASFTGLDPGRIDVLKIRLVDSGTPICNRCSCYGLVNGGKLFRATRLLSREGYSKHLDKDSVM